MKKWLLASYFVCFCLYAIFSYVLTDPNLIISKNEWFLTFQTYLWKNILPLQNLRVLLFFSLIALIFANYLLILSNWSKLELNSKRKFYTYLALLILPLLLSYNALSYDLFNYMFNAKMVIEFGANPHVKTALDFAYDPWTRFMNNTHTPAPYGYTWTGLSLLPYLIGMGKFLSTWLSFKLFAGLAFLLSCLIIEKLSQKMDWHKLAIFAFNPLVLIELLSNGHNDSWMIMPALLSLYLLLNLAKRPWLKLLQFLAIVILMGISIGIKFATVLLLPFLILILLWPKIKTQLYLFDLMGLAMFAPLLTERSRYFLPWYLIWALSFLPLIRNKILRNTLIVFSLSSLLRYLPWLYFLPWMSYHLDTSNSLSWQIAITWILPGVYLLINGLTFLFNRRSEK